MVVSVQTVVFWAVTPCSLVIFVSDIKAKVKLSLCLMN
jgi:hypothetical protein